MMSNLENKKIARDCTISALFFTLCTLAFAMTTGLLVAMFVLGALLLCFLVLILSSVALRKWRLNARDNISRKTKKYLTAIVVLLFITFVFLLIAMIFGYFGYYYDEYYYIYSYRNRSLICETMCFIFSFAAAALNIVEIVLFSIAISLEKKAIPQKLSAENVNKSLQDYRYLYANGLITREEYDTQREKILSQLGL